MCAVAVAAALAITGCGASDDDPLTDRPSEEATPSDTAPTPEDTVPSAKPEPDQTPREPTGEPRPTRSPPDRLTPTPRPTSTPPPRTGEVPAEILDEVLADAADRAATTPDDVVVVRAQAVQWPDGSLGCPEPGMMYTQAIIDGYWVELEAGGSAYDYRLNGQGVFRLCTRPGLEPPPDLRERS